MMSPPNLEKHNHLVLSSLEGQAECNDISGPHQAKKTAFSFPRVSLGGSEGQVVATAAVLPQPLPGHN